MYILILTLIIESGNSGMGGVAMQKIHSLEACEKAGKQWTQQVNKQPYYSRASYLCVKNY